MKRPPPPLTHVRSFECAARHLSFTRAAQELGFTQAAISAHVRALEQYLGRPLFTRNARSLDLTEAGEAFLPTLRQALTQIDTATEAIAKSAREASVVIACPTSLAQIWLPGVLSRFRRTHPDVEVLVHATVWDRPGEDIADLTISVHRDDEVPPGLARLWPEHLMLVCAPQAAARLTTLRQLWDLPQIHVAGRQEYWPLMAQAVRIDAPTPSRAVLRTNGSNVALEMAASGLGATITLAALGQVYVARGLVAEPVPRRAPSPWSYYLRVSQGRRSLAAQAMLEALHAQAAATL